MYCRAYARLAFELEVAAQTLRYDAMRDVQAKTGGAMVTASGEEWIKSMTFDLRRHAASIVREDKLDAGVLCCGHLDHDHSLATAGKPVGQGIEGEIGEGLAERPGVTIHRKIGPALQVERYIALSQLAVQM